MSLVLNLTFEDFMEPAIAKPTPKIPPKKVQLYHCKSISSMKRVPCDFDDCNGIAITVIQVVGFPPKLACFVHRKQVIQRIHSLKDK